MENEEQQIKCHIFLDGKTKTDWVDSLNITWFMEDGNFPSELYTYIAEKFPDNNWDDIECNNITGEEELVIKCTVY